MINNKGKVLHSTGKWNVTKDVKGLFASWSSGSAQFVNMDGKRYSVLQMQPERFIATNTQKKGHLVGSSIPETDMYLIAHIKAKAKGWEHMAYPAIARAAAMMRKGSKSQFIESEVQISNENELAQKSSRMTQPSIDPHLKAEMEGLLSWIKDPQGLPYYIDYALQESNPYRIGSLAAIYGELYRIFYG